MINDDNEPNEIPMERKESIEGRKSISSDSKLIDLSELKPKNDQEKELINKWKRRWALDDLNETLEKEKSNYNFNKELMNTLISICSLNDPEIKDYLKDRELIRTKNERMANKSEDEDKVSRVLKKVESSDVDVYTIVSIKETEHVDDDKENEDETSLNENNELDEDEEEDHVKHHRISIKQVKDDVQLSKDDKISASETEESKEETNLPKEEIKETNEEETDKFKIEWPIYLKELEEQEIANAIKEYKIDLDFIDKEPTLDLKMYEDHVRKMLAEGLYGDECTDSSEEEVEEKDKVAEPGEAVDDDIDSDEASDDDEEQYEDLDEDIVESKEYDESEYDIDISACFPKEEFSKGYQLLMDQCETLIGVLDKMFEKRKAQNKKKFKCETLD